MMENSKNNESYLLVSDLILQLSSIFLFFFLTSKILSCLFITMLQFSLELSLRGNVITKERSLHRTQL